MACTCSRNGFVPNLWGPGTWNLLHVVAANYPCSPSAADVRRAETFVRSLGENLPCASCRSHFSQILGGGRGRGLALSPAVLRSRHAFFKWTVQVHNDVNARLGKPTYKDWRAWYLYYDRYRAT